MEGIKYTTEEYNSKIEKLHFKSNNYINNKTKLDHICLKCGRISNLRPDHLLRYHTKCRHCESKSGFKITNEEYDEMLISKNFTRIGDYKNTNTKISHQCKICSNIINIIPKKVLSGYPCKKCYKKIYKSRFSTEKYSELLISKNLKLSDKVQYLGMKIKIDHICLKCNEILNIRPDHVCDKNFKCYYCNGSKMSENQYLNKIKNRNILTLEKFISTTVKIKHQCKICDHIWSPQPCWILHNNTGCPNCSSSKGEKFISEYLNYINLDYEKEKFIKINEINYRFDFYIPSKNLFIEYDGIQHFESIKYFGGDQQLKIVIENDSIKNQWIKDNNLNLLRISYKDDILNKLKDILF